MCVIKMKLHHHHPADKDHVVLIHEHDDRPDDHNHWEIQYLGACRIDFYPHEWLPEVREG